MTEWRSVPDTNLEVSDDGRVRRDGVEWVPYVDRHGYRHVRCDGKLAKLHRLIAAAFIPNPLGKPCVDHIDGDRLNNTISNLRWATLCENNRNSKNRAKASDLPRGVYKQGTRFVAQICYEGKLYHIGTYKTPEEASLHYEAQAAMMFGDFYKTLSE
jgi:hypothetical protein